MKQFRLFKAVAAMLAFVATTLVFTSCDNDDYWGYEPYYPGTDGSSHPTERVDTVAEIAQMVTGQWRGDIRAYALDSVGNAIDSLDMETDIEFNLSGERATSGTGTQYDYYVNSTQEAPDMVRDFSWYVEDNTFDIYINYKEQGGNYMMVIPYADMNLDDRTFTGYLYALDGSEVDDFFFNRYHGQAKYVRLEMY